MPKTQARTDYEQVLAGLDHCQWDHLQVVADAAEDLGDGRSAAGWRWLAKHRLWPLERRGVWGWCAPNGLPRTLPRSATLPPEVLARLPRPQSEYRGGPFKWFATASDALEAMAAAVGEWLAAKETPAA
jgi:hypothetical protein